MVGRQPSCPHLPKLPTQFRQHDGSLANPLPCLIRVFRAVGWQNTSRLAQVLRGARAVASLIMVRPSRRPSRRPTRQREREISASTADTRDFPVFESAPAVATGTTPFLDW
jgi:hypothetical protein